MFFELARELTVFDLCSALKIKQSRTIPFSIEWSTSSLRQCTKDLTRTTPPTLLNTMPTRPAWIDS